MKRVRLILFIISLITIGSWIYFKTNPKVEIKCSYPQGQECNSSEYCIYVEPEKAICVPQDQDNIPTILFPLELEHPTICTQGPRTAKGRTHSYQNTAFAIDLSTPSNVASGKILAAIDGKILTVNNNCDNKDKDNENFNNDRCGNGFGNWIIIADDKNEILVFYAHLRSIFKNNGERVMQGMVIGEEGKTGSAGHRHLHFSVHRNIWNMSQVEIIKYNPGLPPSINYIFKGKKKPDTSKLPCVDNNDLNRLPLFGKDL